MWNTLLALLILMCAIHEIHGLSSGGIYGLVDWNGRRCKCTAKDKVKLQGRLVQGYCNKWGKDDTKKWCYIEGVDTNPWNCFGATKSTKSSSGKEIYWSSQSDYCAGEFKWDRHSYPRCICTEKYQVTLQGTLVKDYCSKWEQGDTKSWCYVEGLNVNAKDCPGAKMSTKKSSNGETIYWSNKKSVCSGVWKSG